MTPGFALLQRILDTRRIDPEAQAWLVDGLRLWDAAGAAGGDGGDGNLLLRCLNIPTTPAKRRQAVRDRWLAAASDVLGGATLAQRTALLAQAVARFERQWFRLRHSATIPPDLDEVDGCLFLARRASPPPGARQLRNILSEAFCDGNFQPGEPAWQGDNPP